MFLGDYFDFGGPFSSGLRGLATQLFRDRSAGDWDYFPRGFGEPCYRVNTTMRQRILDQALFIGRRRYIALTGAPIVFVSWFFHHFEDRLFLVVIAGLVFGFLSHLHRRRRIRAI